MRGSGRAEELLPRDVPVFCQPEDEDALRELGLDARAVTDGLDWVTQDIVIEILHDEEGHRRLFEGYLREYEAEGLA